MSKDNLVLLFGGKKESPKTSKKKAKKVASSETISSRKSIVDIIAQLDLNVKHPITGIRYKGYMTLSCVYFIPEIFRELSPGEMKLHLYMKFLLWRHSIRPGHIRAAVSYLSKGTSISPATIHVYLSRLEELGLIECVEVDHDQGNVYLIDDFAFWKPNSEPKPQSSPNSGDQFSENQTTPYQNLDNSPPENREQFPKNESKEYSSLSSSLSLSEHAGFKKRWASLGRPDLEKERNIIQALVQKHPEDLDEMFQALMELETTGRDYKGRLCYSPIGLISSSWINIKLIRNQRKMNSEILSQTTHQIREGQQAEEGFKQAVNTYLESLQPDEEESLLNKVENSLRQVRPNGVLPRNTLIFRKFLEEEVASRLGITVPETI